MTMQFAANLNRMWADEPVVRRFEVAAQHGFEAVEYLYPHDHTDVVDQALEASGIAISLFNIGLGDMAAGDRGLLTIPGREDDFLRNVEQDLQLAKRWGVTQLHAVGGTPPASDRGETSVATAITNLREIADACQEAGVSVHVEFINDIDVPGFGVPSLEDAVAIVRALDHPAVRLQFDQYHVGMVGLDPIEEYRRFRDLVAYVQVADIDGRHEPAPGSRAVPDFVDALVQDGYDGVIGLEYDPRADTPAGLTWLDPWREPRETGR